MNELFDNQLVTGGLLLLVSGSLIALCRKIPLQLGRWLIRRLTVSIEVLNNDQLYDWLKVWLNSQPYTGRARSLTASSHHEEDDDGIISPRILFTPAPGNHLLIYQRRLIWLGRQREAVNDSPLGHAPLGSFRESVTLRMLGRDTEKARQVFADIKAVWLRGGDARIRICVPVWGSWRTLVRITPRDLNSVILPEGMAEDVLADIQWFVNSASWYRQRGIPYRRGYLLHGTPGSGKTSLIKALAGELHLDLYVFNLAAHMSDQRMMDLFLNIPGRAIILFEDVDALFEGRKQSDENEAVTFSGLLNALDGIGSKEGQLIFMTTNHRDRLDAALIRPGRIDKPIEFGLANANQAARLYQHFYPNKSNMAALEFGYQVTRESISMAEVQERLIQEYRRRPQAVAAD